MTHLGDEALIRIARDETIGLEREHLDVCVVCRREVEHWRFAAHALTAADEPITIPPVGGVLQAVARSGAHNCEAVRTVPVWGLWHSARLAALIVAAQLRLMGRIVLPLSLLGTVVGFALSTRVPPHYSARVFAAAVCLVAVVSGLSICVPSREPRGDLFQALPVSPPAVVLARSVMVLGLTFLLAALASVVVAGRTGVGVASVVAAWLGPSAVAASAALLLSVWRSTAFGAVTGACMWLLGTLGVTLRVDTPAAFTPLTWTLNQVWTTSAYTLLVAFVMMIAACFLVAPPSKRGLFTSA